MSYEHHRAEASVDGLRDCLNCGIQLVLHEVTENGDMLHPLSGLDERFYGKVCEDNDE